jgi:hypothetical protein
MYLNFLYIKLFFYLIGILIGTLATIGLNEIL